jgi:hypothetical protein
MKKIIFLAVAHFMLSRRRRPGNSYYEWLCGVGEMEIDQDTSNE